MEISGYVIIFLAIALGLAIYEYGWRTGLLYVAGLLVLFFPLQLIIKNYEGGKWVVVVVLLMIVVGMNLFAKKLEKLSKNND